VSDETIGVTTVFPPSSIHIEVGSAGGKGIVEGPGVGLIGPPGHERHIEGVQLLTDAR